MSSARSILIVDDDATLRETLMEQLAMDGEFLPLSAGTVAEAEAILAAKEPRCDAVLLDIGLPDGDGRELCAKLRQGGLRIPIIMLTGADTEQDVVRGLDAGANDYIAKPFRLNELLARLRAQLRVFDNSEDAVFTIGPYQFRPSGKLLLETARNRKIRLTEKESAILKYLYRSGGRPVGRQVLLNEVWGYNSAVTTHTLETHIYRLRQKIEPDPSNAVLLLTEGGGYRLDPAGAATAPADPPAAPEPGAGAALRRLIRGSEIATVLLAVAIGAAVGGIAFAMGATARALHALFYGIEPHLPLSAATGLDPWRMMLAPALGGLLLHALNRALRRWRPRQAIDPIEANALHGGRMPLGDTLAVAAQTVLSNGVGASVGLEAGYAQAGGGLASRIGAALALRRGDLRVLVGAGAAGAIGAAFDAPLTGAFYAFELVIGSYAIPALFPVIACAVTAVLVARQLSAQTYEVVAAAPSVIDPGMYPLAMAVGLLCGLTAIVLMRGVGLTEAVLARAVPHAGIRLLFGGLCVGGLALISPVALSAGHGALHLTLLTETGVRVVAALLLVKALASLISIASGFRGGLFFASLLIGGLGGKLFAAALALISPPGPDAMVMALVGMSAFGAAVIGAPLAMTFLALETTGSLQVAGLVLASVAVAGLMVRQFFGYNFATWRFHLRGEAIRSAHDIGWIDALAAGRLMRSDVPVLPAAMALAEFRAAVPLGAATRVVLTDAEGRYAGMLSVPEAHAADAEATLSSLALHTDRMLLPDTGAREAMAAFAAAEADALAVTDPESGRVLGVLTEAHLLRRFGEEVERRRREESGAG